MSTEDSNRVGSAEVPPEPDCVRDGDFIAKPGEALLAWGAFTVYLSQLEQHYRNFTLIVRRRNDGAVEVKTKWLGLRNDAVIQPSPLRR